MTEGFRDSDDSALVSACLRGEQEAWRALIDRYKRLIYSVPVRYRFSEEDAAEVFQETCVRLYEKLHLLRSHDRLASWLLTTASRICWSRHAAVARAPQSLDSELGEFADERTPLPGEDLEQMERRHWLLLALGQLPESCRSLLERLFLGEGAVSYKEIARELQIPEGSIGPTRQRCLARLGEVLRRLGYRP